MRTKPILTLCTFLAVAIGSATSTSISTVVETPIRDFFSLDQQHHWALIRNKDKKEFLFRTDDGGAHWASSLLPFQVWRVFFTDASEGWGIAAERRGEFFYKFCIHTSDSGQTWQRLGAIAAGQETPTGIAFDSSQHGWVVGEGLENDASGAAFVMETNDGGMHWTKLKWTTQPASGFYGVRLCSDQMLAWTAGSGGNGIYELHSGATPKRIFDHEIMDLACFTNGPLLALSTSSFYLQATDSADWDETDQSFDAVFRTFAFADPQHGCIAGGEMYCTQDGGKTWTSRALPKVGHKKDTISIFGLWMINEDLSWAVTEDAVYEITENARKWTKVDFFDKTGKPLGSFQHN